MYRVVCAVSAAVALSAPATPASAQPAQPALPQVLLDTTYPTQTGATITVNSGGDLQQAINGANPGDTILLQAGATFTPGSSFRLIAKSNPNHKWIVIRSNSAMFDATGQVPPGTRVNGADATQTAQMARLRASGNNNPVIKTDQSSGSLIAGYYRLVGLDIGAPAAAGNVVTMVDIGSDAETNAANQPSFISLDRVYVHGNDTGLYRRGVALNGSSLAIIDSYLSNFHDGADAQAASGWNGPGPFKIVNNFLEASGENVMFGGSDPKVPQLVPSDIEVRRNFMTKRLSWRGVDGYTVKNVFELKNAQRVLLDGNVLEYSWEDGQAGYILVMTPRNQNGQCSWCVVRDVTITNNLMRHGAGLMNLLAFDDINPSGRVQRLAMRNNLSDDINTSWFESGSGNTIKYLLIRGGGAPSKSPVGASDLTFDHNTFIVEASHVVTFGDQLTSGAYQTVQGFAFTKNLIKRKLNANPAYGVEGDPVGVLAPGTATLNAYVPAGYTFQNNGVGNVTSSQYPTGNQYPNLTTWDSQFVNYNGGIGGDYHLISGNVYAAAGNGDVGVDFVALDCAINGTSCPGGATLVFDNFNDNSIGVAWSPGVPLTGTTADPSVLVREQNARLEIGPLNQNTTGVSYNGMRSQGTYNFSGGSVHVQVVQPPNAGDIEAHAMLGAGRNSDNYYRIRISGNTVVAEKRLAAGNKVTLATLAYDPPNHQYLRIRHDGASGSVVFETAGTPGAWSMMASDSWDTVNVPLSAVAFELKAGTTGVQPNPPGTVAFDNFSATRP